MSCGCDPAQHDTVICRCGHRVVSHAPKTKFRGCERCRCTALQRQPHEGGTR